MRPIWDVRRRSVRWAHVCPPPSVRPGLTTALHPTTPFPPVLSRRTFEVSYLGTKHADPAFDPFVRGLCGVGLVANRCPGRIGDWLLRYRSLGPRRTIAMPGGSRPAEPAPECRGNRLCTFAFVSSTTWTCDGGWRFHSENRAHAVAAGGVAPAGVVVNVDSGNGGGMPAVGVAPSSVVVREQSGGGGCES